MLSYLPYSASPPSCHPWLVRLSYSALLGLPSARVRLKGGSPPVIQTESSAQRFHCVLALPALAALRYYDGSDSCGPSPRATGLPAYLATPSQHSAPSHVACPGIALHATNQRTGRVSDFALEEQARRHTPPNRVRHPADCQFASSCSPPRLAATQLPSATGSWLTLARTLTVLVSRLHGRTHSRLDRESVTLRHSRLDRESMDPRCSLPST